MYLLLIFTFLNYYAHIVKLNEDFVLDNYSLQVTLLMRVHHTNLTSLVGYCNEGDTKALIYEYMENGDLESQVLGLFSTYLSPLSFIFLKL